MHDLVTSSKLSHYYGDIVRALFLCATAVMLLGLPTFVGYIQLPTMVSVFAMLVLGCAAGLTNPVQLWSAVLNVIISLCGFIVFESYAVIAYTQSGSFSFLMANLVLGFIFMAAFYFSMKTARGAYTRA